MNFKNKLAKQDSLRIHLIGVAGSGMSGLASLLLDMGHRVSGSDRVTSSETQRLQDRGLRFSTPHTAETVFGVDAVVYSSAIKEDNVALVTAKKMGILIVHRAECLATILAQKNGAIIAGTHGKTTTSSLSTHILLRGSKNPSYYVGAEIPILGANAHWNEEGEVMIAEADESDGTLVLYQANHAVVLNVEEDHLDFYRDLNHIKEVFSKMLNDVTGSTIYCSECQVASELCAQRNGAISYGWSDADYVAEDVVEQGGSITFNVLYKGELKGRVKLGIPGLHNVLNALASIALTEIVGADFSQISHALSTFSGAKRRFETIYKGKKIQVVDDYGHHPTEIAVTLQTAKSLGSKRVIVLFQPHRYSRTQKLAKDFGEALQGADRVFVASIYPASEAPIEGVTSETIVKAAQSFGDVKIESVGCCETAHHVVGNSLQEGDLLITLGAGDVHEFGKKIARDLRVLEDLEELKDQEGSALRLKLYEPIKRHTTILIGGPAQFWVEPSTEKEFSGIVNYCRDRGVPLRVIGRGSNLLVRDGGLRGVVLHPSKGFFSEVHVNGNQISAGVGVRFKKMAMIAQKHGLTGFEWMEGIPGNVGGGLRMNAGAMGVETFDQLVSLRLLGEDGKVYEKGRDEIEAFYRNTPELQFNFGLAATFRGKSATSESIKKKLKISKEKRKSTQPQAASAGCIFKNPEEIPAGLLVDTIGFKNVSVGKARVSVEHGNFIVNDGGASAQDVLDLIEKIRKKSQEEKGITLDTEIQIIGEKQFVF